MNMELLIASFITLITILFITYLKTKRKGFLAAAIILSVVFAVMIGIRFFGGELLWIRIVMNLPIPEYFKGILFGW